MHLYFMLRGILSQTRLFKMFMQTQMWLWKRKDLKTGKEILTQVQGSLRECGMFYEYIFPEECLDEVLTLLDIQDKDEGLGGTKRFVLRRMIGNGVRKIPKYKKVVTNRYIEMRGCTIYPIGIKKDKRREVEEWGVEQEML